MTSIPTLTVNDVFQAQHKPLGLTWLAGRSGADRRLEAPTARYPGMALVGHLNFIHPNRVQVLGVTEINYLDGFNPQMRVEHLEKLFSCPTAAMVIVAGDLPAPMDLLEYAEAQNVALFSTALPTPRLIDSLQYFLARALAECVTLHGVFMEVMGFGVLLTGESGIGKSEVALELLSRNHRLIADDAVEFARVAPDFLEGRCPEALHGFMEVRGLGILNIRAMFGETAVTQHTRNLNLIVRFEQMSRKQMEKIDRLQIEKQTRNILGIEVPEVVLLVAPGRDLAVLVEAAVRNYIQQLRGINPVEDLISRQQARMQQNRTLLQTTKKNYSRSNK